MKLKTIDKSIYRKHLNILIFAGIVSLAVLSLAISQSTIYFFTDRQGTHFWINVMGVVIAMILIGSVLNKIKHKPFMKEVYYVWQLKQQINYIYRKSKKIEQAVQNNQIDAIQIMYFYYKACEQLYNLDDNTITLNSLVKKSNELQNQIDELNLSISTDDYQQQMLSSF